MNGKFSKLKDIHSRFTWLELLLLTGWIFLMCIYISPGAFRHTVGFMLRNPLLILLNVLPIAVLLLVIYFACMNSFASGAATNLVFGLLSYANLLKIDGRDDPLVPADILLLREALQASGVKLLNYGTVFATISDEDKPEALPLIRRFYQLGFNIEATSGTAAFLKRNGIRTHALAKISDGSDEIPNAMRQGHIAYFINTKDPGAAESDGAKLRLVATEYNVTMFTALDTVKVLLDVLEETTLTISTIDAR